MEQIVLGLSGNDGSHDISHCRRVYGLAVMIAKKERCIADQLILIAAAYRHDIVNSPKDSDLRSMASTVSAEQAGKILHDEKFPADKIPSVQHDIAAHSFSANIEPKTLEAKIIQDADRIEALGAIGLARTFYVGGSMSRDLFDPFDPMAERRPLDDSKYVVDHFQSKLLNLPKLMKTVEGRKIATDRARILSQYLNQLLAELAVGSGGPIGS